MPSHSLKLLITRPEKQATQLAKKCALINVPTLCQPLFSYQENSSVKPHIIKQLSNATILIFVSVAAVEFAQQIQPINKWQNVVVIAVGKATQKALLAYGVSSIIPQEHTSEGLLLLPVLQKVCNKSAVIVRGDGGRELIAQVLTERGAKVQYLEVYQRILTPLPQNISKIWQQESINAVLVTSVGILESIENLVDLCDNYWKNTCLWIVASQRIAAKAKSLGLAQVVNAKGANDEAIVVAIKEYGNNYAK